ncbi:MAG: asparagine--tRNA ligase, partial [Lachnospiraceae bacterium]|nr:asparagine--tRNA ligase [Lachnospiraceae bacterium]
MGFVNIKELFKNRDEYIGKDIEVAGWIRSIRDSKTFGFIVLSDGTYFDTLQIVYADKLDNFNEICKLNVGAAVIVKGKLVATPDAKQPFEI